ncbi:BAI1-associated protein 3-like [Pollicipes pollicipes]|uniref:BAI1-associated protein 3-like n=1 Tax=Pollicipes pollicipes TaxID=41117 RepID=UPI001884EEAE|nr:BAI1-associated protein 3-like [Pollicipes pollicipes]
MPSQGATISPELCAHINNMEHVRRPVQEMLDQFQREELPTNGAALHQAQMSDGAGGGVSGMAASLSGELEGRVLEVCSELAEGMRPDLKRHIFHLAWSPDNLPTEEAICPLMDYLDQSLVGLHADLMKRNFDRALLQIWLVTISELKEQADSLTDDKTPAFYARLCDSLEILRKFFHADGQGVPLDALKCDLFDATSRSLKLNSLSTEQLMDMFHKERLEAQEAQEAQEFGTLSVRVYFHHDSLSVEILNAKNVIPLDPNGLSDPFVIIELLPRQLFASCVEQQTVVHKRTLNPVFDECFEYSVTLEQCRADGAMILFTVMDHDVLTFNDFAGEAYLSLNHIPGVDRGSANSDNFHGLKEIELNLMHQRDREHPILKTLESRHWDKAAQDFLKKCRERVTSF